MGSVNVRQWHVTVLVGAVLVLSGVGPMTQPVGAAPPEVAVRVDGATLPAEGSVTVTDDPDVAVQVTADSTLEVVSVRVDGEIRRRFSPDSTSLSETFTVDLSDGRNELTVVAATTETSTYSATVVKDSSPPNVQYTSPFNTSRREDPDDIETVDRGRVNLAGNLFDDSGVDRIVIERVYEWRFAGRSESDRKVYRLDDPSGSFAQPLLLGPGANEMKVTLTDVHGHKQIQSWTIEVDDRTAPRIRVEAVEQAADGSKVRVSGTVSDETKVQSLSYGVTGSAGKNYVLNRVDKEPTRERVSTEFEFTARAVENAESLTLVAKDTAGNERRRSVSLNIEERVKPTVSFDREATAYVGDELHVVGTVSAGRFTRVAVETVSPDGDVLSLRTVYEGEATRQVSIDGRFDAAGDGTTVVVRVVDTLGREHTHEFRPGPGADGSLQATGNESAARAGSQAFDAETTPALTSQLDRAPAEITADAPAKRLVLDVTRRRVGVAVVDGAKYVVYRYENRLPYANGVEVYRGEQRVTDRATVRKVAAAVAAQRVLAAENVEHPERKAARVASRQKAQAIFRKMAWRRALSDLTGADRKQLRRIQTTAKRIDSLTSRPLEVLGTANAAIERAKSNKVLWVAATRLYPSIDEFAKVVQATHDEVKAWHDSAAQTRQNVTSLLESVDKTKRGESANYERLSKRMEATTQSLRRLETQTNELHSQLTRVADTSDEIATTLSAEVPTIGEPLAAPLRELASVLRGFAGQVADFRDGVATERTKLTNVRAAATSEQSRLVGEWQSERERLVSRWQARRSAKLKVYGTLGGGGVSLLSLVGALLWRRD